MTLPRFQCNKCKRLFNVKNSEEDMQKNGVCPFCNEIDVNDLGIDYNDTFSTSKSRIDACYSVVSILKKDRDFCDGLLIDYLKDNCLSGFFKGTKNEKDCEILKIDNNRDWCLHSVAYNNQNYNACSKIEDEWIRSNCYGQYFIKNNL